MDSPCIKQTVCKVLKIFQYGKYLVAYVLKSEWSWGHRLKFHKNVFFILKIDFALASSADPDEVPPYASFHPGLHYLPKYLFRDFRSSKG